MHKVERCSKCDGDVIWMEFKKSLCCSWCGLRYDNDGKPNELESVEGRPELSVKHARKTQ